MAKSAIKDFWSITEANRENIMSKIVTFITYNDQLEAAVKLYTSIFKNSKIKSMSRGGPGPDAPVFSAEFELDGKPFVGLNGGPTFSFSDGISLFVSCETQAEVDHFCEKLTTDGGKQGRCGWLKDKFGVSWQIIPTALGQLMGDPNPAKAQAVMQAMLQMDKIDIAGLRKAHAVAV